MDLDIVLCARNMVHPMKGSAPVVVRGELAHRTGLQAPNLSRLESGKHMPSMETLERVAEALDMRMADLASA